MPHFVYLILIGVVATAFALWMIFTGPPIITNLIGKYLWKRRIAWVSLIAVILCTTMVIVVISVMGGWLRMFKESFHGLSGDVLIESRSLSGFPYYQEMIDQVQTLPEVQIAVPTIRTFGLVKIGRLDPDGVQVIGYPIESIGIVNKFPQSLHRQYQSVEEKGQKPGPATFELPLSPEEYRAEVRNPKIDPTHWPGMIVSTGVVGIHKDEKGNWVGRSQRMYRTPATLTVMGIPSGSTTGDLDMMSAKSDRRYWIVDDSRTQIYQYDQSTVYVPFSILQADLGMAESEEGIDNVTGKKIISPARTTTVEIKVRDGYNMDLVQPKVEKIAMDVMASHGYLFADKVQFGQFIRVQTWEQSQATWIHAIENEKLLVVILFGIISIVAIFLIFCIFYMIVVEKTRDIGIIKSVGATNSAVAGIFLGYGLAIGLFGAGLGFLLGWFIVSNINMLHTEMGRLLGWQIWSPEVYAFDTIPSTMDPKEVTIIMLIAVVASVLGALVPALRAARMHPVESLRWE